LLFVHPSSTSSEKEDVPESDEVGARSSLLGAVGRTLSSDVSVAKEGAPYQVYITASLL